MVAPAPSQIEIFDRALIRKRRSRVKALFPDHDFLFRWSKAQLSERLLDINRSFPKVLQLGSRGSFARGEHPKLGDFIVTCDLGHAPVDPVPCPKAYHYIQSSEEFLPIARGSMDAVITNLNLHSVNDLPGSFVQIRKSLKNDGLFLGAMLGGETLHELRATMTQAELDLYGGVSPRIFPFADKRQIGDLLVRAGFALPVVDSDVVTVTYDHAFALFSDLRGMGENNSILARDKNPVSKAFFQLVAQYYHDRSVQKDGRILASFEVIFFLGWAPDASQQKPLAPGSAKQSLASVLETTEIKTGDKTKP